MRYYLKYNSPLGELYLIEEENFLVEINFYNAPKDTIEKETSFLIKCRNELAEYFNKERKEFTIPIKLKGTDFQKKVWNSLLKIPFGETRSYKDIAIDIGNSKASRAVGMANNRNPLPIIVPCHRVIGSNKKLVGYGGGLDKKIFLLELEKEGRGCCKFK